MKGAKEAKWNFKYLKVIEMPVTQITQARKLRDLQLCLIPMMKSIKHIFENSNFYKEVRIVSLLDRLLDALLEKIKGRVNITLAFQFGKDGQYDLFFDEHTQMAVSLIRKYNEHFFIRDLMDKDESYSSNATHSTNETSSESSENSKTEERKMMGQSFYKQEGLEYLYFARPGTAYGSQAFQNSSLGKPVLGKKSSKASLPVEMQKVKGGLAGKDSIKAMWVDRAERILMKVEHYPKIIEFVEHVGMIVSRFNQDYLPLLRKLSQQIPEAIQVRKEFYGLLELFETRQPEYDIWDFHNMPTFQAYMDNFESKARTLEEKIDSLQTGRP